ncbi:MAG: hypothetical protein ACR2IE_04265 [Candidatus Sumerlaeaceae bacterium]
MALIALGHSKCAVCGGILQEGDDIMGFPDAPLTRGSDWFVDQCDLVFRFADRGCHKQCFSALPEAQQIHQLFFGRALQ